MTNSNVIRLPERDSHLIEHMKGKHSFIAITAKDKDDSYDLIISEDLLKFDVISLLYLALNNVANSGVEDE